jgi:hypothetical protein
VHRLGLFSKNEEKDDIATVDLKYLLVSGSALPLPRCTASAMDKQCRKKSSLFLKSREAYSKAEESGA